MSTDDPRDQSETAQHDEQPAEPEHLDLTEGIPADGDEQSGPSEAQLAEILGLAHRAALAAGADAVDADEVAQTVAMNLWVKWKEPHVVRARNRGLQSWAGYVRAAARNAKRDLDRSDRRRAGREFRSQGWPLSPPSARPGTLRPPVVLPSMDGTDLEYRARVELVDLILTSLPERDKPIARCIFIEGLSVTETAELLGLSPRTIRRAKQIIVAELRRRIVGDDAA